MGDQIVPDGPFEVELKVRFMLGEDVATATVALPLGKFPEPDEIRKAIRAAQEQLGAEFVIMGRHAFMRQHLAEQTGNYVRFAVPGPDAFSEDWDALSPTPEPKS